MAMAYDAAAAAFWTLLVTNPYAKDAETVAATLTVSATVATAASRTVSASVDAQPEAN